MAVEIEAPGQLQEFLEILKKRKWLVILPAVFVLTLGSAFAVLVPKKYMVDTQVELRGTRSEEGERGSNLGSQMREGQTAELHIKAPNRIRAVIEHLKWTDYLGMSQTERHDFVRRTMKAIEVKVTAPRSEAGSTFVTIEYRDVDPQRAVEFLDKLRDDWTTNEVERGRRAIEARGQSLLQRRTELQAEFQAKQDELSRLQSAHGLSPTQPVPGGQVSRNEDPRFDLYQQKLTAREDVAKELSEAEAELEALRSQLETVEPQVKQVIQGESISYAAQIDALELEIEDLHRRRQGRRRGSIYRLITNDIELAQEQIQALRDRERRADVREEWVENPVYADLRDQMRQAELAKVRHEARLRDLDDELAREKDELRERHEVYAAVRRESNELDRLGQAIDDVSLEWEKNLRDLEVLAGPAGNPFQITSPVAAPSSPTEPDPLLILAFSLVAGIGIGLALAVLSEYSKSCFRNPSDISRVMVVPVLGVVNTIRTRNELRRERLRRGVVGASTVLLVAVVSFVTWAWAAKQHLLSPWLLEQIEDFRKLFV